MLQHAAMPLQAGVCAEHAAAAAANLEHGTQYVHTDGSIVSQEPLEGLQWGVTVYDFGEGQHEVVGYRLDEKPSKKKTGQKVSEKRSDMKDRDRERSAARARRDMRHKTMMMKADRMLTLTVRDNIEDRSRFLKYIDKFRRRVLRQWKDFRSVVVLEKQQRGAYHAHMALKGYYNINLLRYFWREALCGNGKASGEDSPGNVQITSPRKGYWNRSKISRYLSKYMSKESLDLPAGTKRYVSWGKIEKPKKYVFYIAPTMDPFYLIKKITEEMIGKRLKRFFEPPIGGGLEVYWYSSYT